MSHSLFDLTGKRAFITGATKGIGRAIAEAFADHGTVMVLTSRHGTEAQAAAEEINQRVGRGAAIGIESDLLRLDRLIASYDEALAHFGQIDVLVCNAAATSSIFGSAQDFSTAEYTELMQANIVNNVALMNHAATGMRERCDGVILVTSSASGVRPSYGVFPYGVAKAGLNHAVRCLAGELAPFNVRVNGVAPGLTRSWSLEQSMKEDAQVIDRFRQGIPLRRIIQPEEIAAGMVFLASEGGKAMTGQIIVMDGGEPGPGVMPGV
ncbi:SDR family NAD(P)-dependent oxidoreductase [Sphingobium sp.]|uniref:SDR family NAD(P)-dependent oxidoreductase n=1 Tax=Sphingobium sp. TaxID=1912891 RepID=UPI002C119816|nr:SDR family oxidoreductase [Sphingobium sp.]HUD90851.1 SDR family oxidoreductase [Sphingobium sp.]